jgi:hypothetical protein
MAAMATYVRAGLPEVATALAALTGEPHPLAVTPSGAVDVNREKTDKAELNAGNSSAKVRPDMGT